MKRKINEENLDDFTTQRQSDEIPGAEDYEARKDWEDGHRLVIDWFGLKFGPVYLRLTDPRIKTDLDWFKMLDEYRWKSLYDNKIIAFDEDVVNLEKNFWKQLGSRENFTPEKMKKFAEDHGWEVVWNIYDYPQRIVAESMSETEEKEFREAMKEGPVEFEYKKVDGTVRKAKGTLKEDLMDLPPQASGKDVEAVAKKKHFVPPTVFVYWDLDAGGFRSFRKDNFIKFKKVESKKDD